MVIALIPNITRKNAIECTHKIIEILIQNNSQIIMPQELKNIFFNTEDIIFLPDIENLINNCDIAITVGGDGTIIDAAKYAASANKSLIGVNCGRIGFVASLEPNEIYELNRLFTGDYNIEKRMLLKVISKFNGDSKEYYALNDAVVRGATANIIDLDVDLDNNHIGHFRADGLIVSTPTGSTAYSLSAGGPVIQPNMKCILLTPLAAYSLFSKPIVFNENAKIKIYSSSERNENVMLFIDGQLSVQINKNTVVEVMSADIYANFITFKDKTFYKVLNEKLSERSI